MPTIHTPSRSISTAVRKARGHSGGKPGGQGRVTNPSTDGRLRANRARKATRN